MYFTKKKVRYYDQKVLFYIFLIGVVAKTHFSKPKIFVSFLVVVLRQFVKRITSVVSHWKLYISLIKTYNRDNALLFIAL